MMIKVNELRIGNLVNYEDEALPVLKIDGDVKKVFIDLLIGLNMEMSEDDLRPIPLTGDWLERLGQKCENGNGWTYQIPVGALKWYFRWNTEWYSEVGGIYIDSRVQYVHQLQNLYFALTGKEIEIKQPA
jgi:hypothetical protein